MKKKELNEDGEQKYLIVVVLREITEDKQNMVPRTNIIVKLLSL
jgi:hypothetical protein